jgi:probable F420-dependent oxidoreductase
LEVADVLVGAVIPNTGALPEKLGIGEMARAAEAAGASSVWVSDHLLMIDAKTNEYPYSADGGLSWRPDVEYYESLACCALMAAATQTCRVGPAVLVLPQRNVLELAKIAATLDRLSGGRFVLGVGGGWYSVEMEALGYPFGSRGGRMNEMIDVLRDCWTGRPSARNGEHVTIPPDVVLSPVPAQPDGVPILVGGMTGPALRRAATKGDGWLALDFVGTFDGDALAARLENVCALRRDAGGGEQFNTVLKLHAKPAEMSQLAPIAREVKAMGFDEIMVELPWSEGLTPAAEVLSGVRDAVT